MQRRDARSIKVDLHESQHKCDDLRALPPFAYLFPVLKQPLQNGLGFLDIVIVVDLEPV